MPLFMHHFPSSRHHKLETKNVKVLIDSISSREKKMYARFLISSHLFMSWCG